MALFSNSSVDYFPENKTTHFVTKLPKRLNLRGNWAVALLDIHVPLNFQTLPKEDEKRCVTFGRTLDGHESVTKFYIFPGIYTDLKDLIHEINDYGKESHLEFILKPGSYTVVRKSCENVTCNYVQHKFDLCMTLKKILGFQPDRILSNEILNGEIWSDFPANLNASLPNNLFIYADICQPYMTGDICSKLLRNVALDHALCAYGRTLSANFSQPIYVPLLTTSFETIEILIRDGAGEKVPIDHGLLSLTLRFKRFS